MRWGTASACSHWSLLRGQSTAVPGLCLQSVPGVLPCNGENYFHYGVLSEDTEGDIVPWPVSKPFMPIVLFDI